MAGHHRKMWKLYVTEMILTERSLPFYSPRTATVDVPQEINITLAAMRERPFGLQQKTIIPFRYQE